jgi:hypothetical protein
MSYPSSGSTMGTRSNVGLSPQILVKVGNTTVGAIQSFNIDQDKDIVMVEEIGNDGIIESHPKGSAKVILNVNRFVFDNLRLPEAFGRGFVNIQSQRIPFDIHVFDRSTVRKESGVTERVINRALGKSKFVSALNDYGINTNLETGDITRGLSDLTSSLGSLGVGFKETEPYIGHIVHTYHNCWIKKYTAKYEAENYLILETANFSCEYVTSMVDSKNVSTGGNRGIQYDYDSIERVTDLTGNRGKFYAVVDDRNLGKKIFDAIF